MKANQTNAGTRGTADAQAPPLPDSAIWIEPDTEATDQPASVEVCAARAYARTVLLDARIDRIFECMKMTCHAMGVEIDGKSLKPLDPENPRAAEAPRRDRHGMHLVKGGAQ